MTIVEPTLNLMMQSILKLEPVDYKLHVISVTQMLEDPLSSDVYIINEYDGILQDHSFSVRKQVVRGIWELRDKKVFAFSATSSPAHERILDSAISPPVV